MVFPPSKHLLIRSDGSGNETDFTTRYECIKLAGIM